MNKSASLPPKILHIIRDKGTELPGTGEYTQSNEKGTYLCRQCGLALFRSSSQFHAACGWPSFDEEIAGTVNYQLDVDQHRTEILCARCGGHLGHVFEGERLTDKNKRYCVNSASLDFVTDTKVKDSEEGFFAGGCFWGVEYLFQQLPGVLKTEVGYMGGHQEDPAYEEVCDHGTGHLEVTRVLFDPSKITYESVAQYFFEIHDPTQLNRQGGDVGEQYKSAVFYYNAAQKETVLSLINTLKKHHYAVTTQLLPVSPFWKAEMYHQDYYQKTGKKPYCHIHIKRF